MVDVQRLRRDAASRAAARPRPPFDGTVEDRDIDGVPTRRYAPHRRTRPGPAFFAHGGYGLFGTLDLQDGYCRTLAQQLGRTLVAVDYRLTPEHTFSDAVSDVVTVARRAAHGHPVVLAGDSAGGALVVAATAYLPATAALLLTNPNLDLTLATFDDTAPDGPDLDLSRYAFTAWNHPRPLAEAPRLQHPRNQMPPTFIAIGARDALLPDARALTAHLRQQHRPVTLLELPGTGHGFISHPETATRISTAISAFLAEVGA